MQIKENEKMCIKCLRVKKKKDGFYNSYDKWHTDGKIPYCKQCIKSTFDEDNIVTVKEILRKVDKPFNFELYEQAKDEPKETLGRYFSLINFNNKYDTYIDSIFERPDDKDVQSGVIPKKTSTGNKIDKDKMMDKWGFGYTNEEYEYFEKKYNTLRNNYQEKTSMHTEALLTYIRYRVKEEIATASGDNKSAKDWGTLASNAAKDAKINPAQLSQADLSDGLDTFGQLIRAVETSEDIIPILPTFKEKAHDKVDFALWCYVNYIRDMQGKELAKYKDVYQFYEDRKKEHEEEFEFDKGNDS